jgi:hypothetical protein
VTNRVAYRPDQSASGADHPVVERQQDGVVGNQSALNAHLDAPELAHERLELLIGHDPLARSFLSCAAFTPQLHSITSSARRRIAGWSADEHADAAMRQMSSVSCQALAAR